jgi:integrase
VVAALRDYLERRRALRPAPAAPALFISACGTRLTGHLANAEFRRITALTGIGANAVNPPRIHDMRHTFAVRTLAGWYRDGGDVAARMPLLSAYLGHVSPVSTYWYLHAVPELLTLAAQRLENAEAAS